MDIGALRLVLLLVFCWGWGGWEAVGVEKVGNLKEQHTKTTAEFSTDIATLVCSV